MRMRFPLTDELMQRRMVRARQSPIAVIKAVEETAKVAADIGSPCDRR